MPDPQEPGYQIQFTDQQPQDPGHQIDFVDKKMEKARFGVGLRAAIQSGAYGQGLQALVKWGDANKNYQAGPPKVADGLVDDIKAGYQASSLGLLVRGRRPDVVLDGQHAKWYDKLLAGAGQLVGDLPAMTVGGTAAGAAGLETGPGAIFLGGAAAFGTPAALRESLMLAYSLDDIQSSAEFLDRTKIVLKNTGKEALVGGLTAGAGALAGRTATNSITKGAQWALTQGESRTVQAATLGAELTTMTVAPAALEGHLPEPEDFLNGAILVLGMKGAGKASGWMLERVPDVRAKLQDIYAKTGKRPEEVVADSKNDPTIVEDLIGGPREPVQGNPANPRGAEAARGVAERSAPENVGAGEGRPDASLQAILRGLAGAERAGIATPGGADFGGLKGDTPVRAIDAGKGGISGLDLRVETFESGRAGAPDIAVTAGDPTSPAYLAGSIKGNTFLVGTMHGESYAGKGVGYDLYQTLGQYLKENHPEVKNVVGLAGGVAGNPDGIVRVRNAFEGTQWEGRWAGTPVESLAKGPKPRSTSSIPRAYQDLAIQEAAVNAIPGLPAEMAGEIYGPARPVPGEPKPTQINYKYINTPEEVNGALSRLSELNLAEIQKQRRGTVSWEQTQIEAGKALAELLGSPDPIKPREPGQAAGAAELLARKQMVEGAANDMAAKAKALIEAGPAATPEMNAEFLASVERLRMLQAEFLGARAEAGRALNILKETRTSAERVQQIQDLLNRFEKSPAELAEMMSKIEDPAGLVKFADAVTKATTWEKVMEAWKAGLVSGPHTIMTNTLSNFLQMATRPLIDAGSALMNLVIRNPEGVQIFEPYYRVIGDGMGFQKGLKLAGSVFMEDAGNAKYEHKTAIPGKTGYVIRTPFRILEGTDSIFYEANLRGELYTQAAKMAAKEGHSMFTREFSERVTELAENPTEAMIDKANDYAKRMTFKGQLGEKGQNFAKLVKSSKALQVVFPFVMTPANIFKETARLSPFAPLVGEWRADYQAGGARQQKAIAEMAMGTAAYATVMQMAMDGHISGAGDPDPNKNRVKMASGWQPYSIKIGDKWYSYQRLQPLGTLFGLAADTAEIHEHMTPDEMDRVPKMAAMAFSNAVTKQTFLLGLSQAVNAVARPDRDGPKFAQSLAASTVPAVIGQTAQLMDPFQREVASVREAVQARIPGLREQLPPQRDPFGEPEANPDRLGFVSPVTQKKASEDMVRTEAARLGIGVAKAPKSITLPAGGLDKIGKVDLTPQQRDIFGDVAGHKAYEILDDMVHSPWWSLMPDVAKYEAYQAVFERTNQLGKFAALSDVERQKEVNRIIETVNRKLKAGSP